MRSVSVRKLVTGRSIHWRTPFYFSFTISLSGMGLMVRSGAG